MTGYIYDAEGNRVAKGTLTSFSCDLTQNGFATTTQYIVGHSGEQITAVDGAGHWLRTNVYVAGAPLATYDAAGLHFNLSDALGTKRLQVNATGTVEQTCQSLPFGDALSCTGAGADDNKLHFTAKERDTESGNDYFGARYLSSNVGRFISPDWSKNPQGVPYADYTNPQSLNLYAYVDNRPLVQEDSTGHFTNSPNEHFGCLDEMGDGNMNGSNCSSFMNPQYTGASSSIPGETALDNGENQYISGDYGSADSSNKDPGGVAPNNGKPGTSGCIATGLQSTFPGSTATMGSSTGEVGGHWNFSLQLQFSSQDAANTFSSMYTAASSGWDPPARFGSGPALHLENLGSFSVSDGTYTIGATAHIDLFNPDTGAGGIAGHVLDDGAWGHIVQFFGGNIDPNGCPFR